VFAYACVCLCVHMRIYWRMKPCRNIKQAAFWSVERVLFDSRRCSLSVTGIDAGEYSRMLVNCIKQAAFESVERVLSEGETDAPAAEDAISPPAGGVRSVLQCVAVCCSVLQCVAMYCSVLHSVAVFCSGLQCVTVFCSVMQCDAECCSVLQCAAVCYSVLQCVAADNALRL